MQTRIYCFCKSYGQKYFFLCTKISLIREIANNTNVGARFLGKIANNTNVGARFLGKSTQSKYCGNNGYLRPDNNNPVSQGPQSNFWIEGAEC